MTRSERLFNEGKVEVNGTIAKIVDSCYGIDAWYMGSEFDCLCNGKEVFCADLYLGKDGKYYAVIS